MSAWVSPGADYPEDDPFPVRGEAASFRVVLCIGERRFFTGLQIKQPQTLLVLCAPRGCHIPVGSIDAHNEVVLVGEGYPGDISPLRVHGVDLLATGTGVSV